MGKNKIKINALYAEITDKCNLACVYCYNDSSAKNKTHIPLDDYKRFVKILINYGLKEVSISGGEPTLHPNLLEMIEFNHSLSLKQHLLTNGANINSKILPIVKHKNVSFQFSIDGPDESSNDALRSKNAYATTTKALKLLVSNGLAEQIVVRSHLHFGNYNQMYPTVASLKDMGVSDIDFTLLTNKGRAVNIELIDAAKHKDIIKEIEDNIATISRDLSITPVFKNEATLSCPYETLEAELSLSIDPQGNINPCQILNDPRFTLGNIHTVSAASLESNISDFSEYVKSRKSNMHVCQRCAYQSLCHGGCVAMSLANAGDHLAVDGQCSIRKNSMRKMLLSKKPIPA